MESTPKVNVVINPIAPSHPIVISCINGGYLFGGNAEQRWANFIVPPFAPVFTKRTPDNPTAPVAVANVRVLDDERWKFLGIAFTGCTLHQARSLSLADPEKARNFRISVIVGGSCTFKCDSGATLEAPEVPAEYLQSYPTLWERQNELTAGEYDDDSEDDAELLVTAGNTGESAAAVLVPIPIAMAGVVLDVGVAKDMRILLK